MASIAADLWAPVTRWRVWSLMASQDIGIRYKRSFLGPFWVSVTMATFVLGVGLLYSQVFDQPVEEYLIYFGCGLLAWYFLLGLVQEGAGAIIEAEQHLRSVPLPIPLLVARAVWRNIIVFLHNALVIFALMMFFGHSLTIFAPLAILGVVFYVLIGFFLGITLAPFCTRYRDVSLVITNFMQIMFFITPIFWTADRTSDRPFITEANPFYHMIALIRQPLLGEAPALQSWVVACGLLVFTSLLALLSLAVARKKIHLWL